MYTPKQSKKMNRLDRQLKKMGYHFYGTQDGFGQAAIFTADGKQVPESDYWLQDFVEGRISGRHITKALVGGITPDEVATEAEAKKRGKMLNIRNSKDNSDLTDRRNRCQHCGNHATQAYCLSVTMQYPLSDDGEDIEWKKGVIIENEDDPIYACNDCGPDGP